MKRFSEQLHKKSETVKLRVAEKRALRERIVSYMEYHPLPADAQVKRVFADKTALTEEYRVIRVPFTLIARLAGTMAVLLFVIVPVMAERAIPGDGLYAIKVSFNEEVRSTLAFSTSQKVAWETERLNRRIAEARLLASTGRLNGEAEATVAAAVRSHTDELQRSIEMLRQVDADEASLASIALETTLEVQSASLRRPATDEVAMMMSVDSDVISDVPDSFSLALEESRAKATASNASSTIPSFDRTMARVEQNTTRIYELLNSVNGVLTEEQRVEVTRRATDINRTIEEIFGTRALDEELAKQQLVEVLQRTQRVIVYLNDVAVSNAIDIEDLVPVVLTDVEKQEATEQFKADIEAFIEQIESATLATDNEALIEKATYSLELLEEYYSTVNTTEDFLVAKAAATTALVVANDILALLPIPELPSASTSTPTTSVTATPATSTATSTGTTTEQTNGSSTVQIDI